MGPRQKSLGNTCHHMSIAHDVIASMGPRQKSLGNTVIPNGELLFSCASMGPRQKSLGNQANNATSGNVATGFNGAEAKKPRKCKNLISSALSAFVLQWGRGKKASEIIIAGDCPFPEAPASMGPRQKSLGNPPPQRAIICWF